MRGITKSLLPEEINNAEMIWVKFSQQECFTSEIHDMKKGKDISKSSKLLTLSPMMDEHDIIRIRGRNVNSPELTEDAKYPIILESKHRYTKLLIQNYHEVFGHCGQETIINELRQKYWIFSIRTAVKKTFRDCQLCKVLKAKPTTPEMGNLPEERNTKYIRPFTMAAVDYFGPYDVTVGRRHGKRYGVLFTCLTTRAIHLEIAHSLSTDSAIMAIMRFTGRRGCPKEMFSDNGTNFRGADSEIKKAICNLDQTKILEKLTTKGSTWNFNPPSAPHMGGSWERLVRSVKTTLKVILKEQAPKAETLETLFVEVENIVNSRPLTFVSNDPEDLTSITPNLFLVGTSSAAPIMGTFSESDFCIRKNWKIAQALAQNFWQRWIKEYLPTLTRRTKWYLKSNPIKEGDLVFIADGCLFKNHWPRGIITKTYPGKDGVIRVVDVKTQYGILRRPVIKLCIIDTNTESD